MVGTKNNSKKVSVVKVNKQKVLLPTLKERQRYIVYKVLSKGGLKDFGNLHNNIILQCTSLLGIFDGAKAGVMSAKYNPEKFTGIIRVNNKYVDKLKVCLGLIKKINNQEVTIDCIYVSGMLNKAAEKMDN